ncbi:MAG: BON domain-containing protein [Syntrophothermus sp.]
MARNDEKISKKVLAAIKQDKELSAYHFNVDTIDGVVHLQGVVDVLAEKERAGEIARGIEGVTGVENGLTVSTDGAITDSEVEFEVAEELHLDHRFDSTRINAESHKGVVHLRGEVKTLAEAEAAVEAASRARGAKEVVNELKVGAGERVDDATLTNRVESALAADGRLDPADVRTSSEHGVVRLKGVVPGRADKELAAEIATSVEGVRRVENELSTEIDPASDVVTEIFSDFQATPLLDDARVSVSVVDGQIRVEGEVYSFRQKREVERAVRRAFDKHRDELIGIDNRLILDSPDH